MVNKLYQKCIQWYQVREHDESFLSKETTPQWWRPELKPLMFRPAKVWFIVKPTTTQIKINPNQRIKSKSKPFLKIRRSFNSPSL